MATLSPDVENKVSTDAAQEFASKFYPALSSPALRKTLSTFYLPSHPDTPTDISLNGQLIPSASSLQDFFCSLPPSHYEVQSIDAHCLNPNYNIGVPEHLLPFDASGKKMSILVVVSGYVKVFEGAEKGVMRGFTETIVLVPNFWLKKGEREGKKWVVQSQNFRTVL